MKKEVIDLRFDYTYRGEIFQLDIFPGSNNQNQIILSKIDNDDVQKLAQDNDADGEIDTLYTQAFSKDSLTQIYQLGVLMNSNYKSLKNHVYSRIFVVENTEHRFGLQSIVLINGKISNRFVVHSQDSMQKKVALDINADGVLEEVLNEDSVCKTIQKQYDICLQAGISQDAIIKNYNMVFIKTYMNERK